MSRQSRRAFLKLAAVSAAGVVATQVRASEPEFGFKTLGNGYQLANNRDSEGKCGEGRCGGSMVSPEKKATSEGKCGEGKCGEGRCGGSMASPDKKATSEGKCGEGRCGGNGYGKP